MFPRSGPTNYPNTRAPAASRLKLLTRFKRQQFELIPDFVFEVTDCDQRLVKAVETFPLTRSGVNTLDGDWSNMVRKFRKDSRVPTRRAIIQVIVEFSHNFPTM
jgi:hypothetical protein